MKTALFFLFFATSMISVSAQNITVEYEPEIERMLLTNQTINKEKDQITAWTVLIHTSRSRTEVLDQKMEFSATYPDLFSEWEYTNPLYKLRSGTFETKLEATRFVYLIKDKFPTSYPAQYNKFKPKNLVGIYY